MACSAWLDGFLTIDNFACSGQSAGTSTYIGWSDPSTNVYFSGDISEIPIYNRALQTAERQSIEQYLKPKWNLPFSYQG